MKKLLYKATNINKINEFIICDNLLFFSFDNNFCEDNIKDIKFYINENNIINNLQEGKYIGYLVTGDLDLFNNNLENKIGDLNNLSQDLLLAIRYLANHLNTEITELPISLYVVGQAALQYWDNKYRATQDLDIIKAEPDDDLFENKKFLDLIKEVDRTIKNLTEDSDEHDLIINNDASFTGNFVFPMVYTKEIIKENILELYFADEEGVSLNKTYAYFVQLITEGRERTKDRLFALNIFKKYGITSKEKLFTTWPEYNNIQEIEMSWDSFFNEY